MLLILMTRSSEAHTITYMREVREEEEETKNIRLFKSVFHECWKEE